MEQKQKVFKWLSIIILGAGFLTYVAYLFYRKPAGMAGTEFEHIGWFIVDVFMIGGAILGLLLPKRFGKLAGFCIVGLSFANLVMCAVGSTGTVFLVNDPQIPNHVALWLEFVMGLIALIAIVCLVLSLAFPKVATILGPVSAIAFALIGFMNLGEQIERCVTQQSSWAYVVNGAAVCLIILGLSAGLVEYSWLLKPGVGENQPEGTDAAEK
jgi:hypothetical protein